MRQKWAVTTSVAAGLTAFATLQACDKRETPHATQAASAAPSTTTVDTSELQRPAAPLAAAPAVFTPEIEELVTGIAEGKRVESSAINYGGTPSSQWQKFERLEELATVEQLVALTDHANAAVRCYAFQALAGKNSDRVFEVLSKHLTDTELVDTQMGCIGSSTRVGDYFVELVTMGGAAYQLNPVERERLNHVLLNDRSIKLVASRHWALRSMKPTPGDYARVREIASVERSPAALRLLAKYRNRADVTLISSFFANENELSAALAAAREFPDEAFYPFVSKFFERAWAKELYDHPAWRLCYQVLAQYPRPETLALFERTLSTKDDFRRQELGGLLLLALTKYPNALFEPLKSKVALEHPRDAKAEFEYDD